jgi:hypothetical protein
MEWAALPHLRGLLHPDWLLLKKRRREIEEGVKFAKMHKKLKHTKN